MTHQHNSNGREWLLVEVPSDAFNLHLSSIGCLHYDYDLSHDGMYQMHIVDIFDTSLTIHSDSLTITEEQAGEIVETEHGFYVCYDNRDFAPFIYATDSYRSLLRSKNINSRVINLVRI